MFLYLEKLLNKLDHHISGSRITDLMSSEGVVSCASGIGQRQNVYLENDEYNLHADSSLFENYLPPISVSDGHYCISFLFK